MKIDTEKMENFLSKVKDANWKCGICGENEWIVPKEVFELTEYCSDIRLKRSYPVVVLTCGKCGHAVMFNAFVSGVVTPGEHCEI